MLKLVILLTEFQQRLSLVVKSYLSGKELVDESVAGRVVQFSELGALFVIFAGSGDDMLVFIDIFELEG